MQKIGCQKITLLIFLHYHHLHQTYILCKPKIYLWYIMSEEFIIYYKWCQHINTSRQPFI